MYVHSAAGAAHCFLFVQTFDGNTSNCANDTLFAFALLRFCFVRFLAKGEQTPVVARLASLLLI